MSTSSGNAAQAAQALSVTVSNDAVIVELQDGRVVSAPLAWYPRLLRANETERGHWRLIGGGEGIHWPDLDEDIEVDQLIAGQPSGESQQSLKRWCDERAPRSS